jgi:hypothetical protein
MVALSNPARSAEWWALKVNRLGIMVRIGIRS